MELYRFFRGLGASFITFLPLVEESGIHPGEATPQSVRPMDFGRFLSSVFDEWIANDIGTLRVQIFEEALRTAFRQEHTLCIFRPVCELSPWLSERRLFSCDHYVTPDYMLGNIGDTSLAMLLDDPRQKAFGEAKRDTLPRYCLGCEVLEM